MLSETYNNYSIDFNMWALVFERYKTGDFDTEDEERPGQSKKFEMEAFSIKSQRNKNFERTQNH